MYIFALQFSWVSVDELEAAQFLFALTLFYKNSSGDEIANVNFYAVLPEATRIR